MKIHVLEAYDDPVSNAGSLNDAWLTIMQHKQPYATGIDQDPKNRVEAEVKLEDRDCAEDGAGIGVGSPSRNTVAEEGGSDTAQISSDSRSVRREDFKNDGNQNLSKEGNRAVWFRLHRNIRLIERRKTFMSIIVTNERMFKIILGIQTVRITQTIMTILWVLSNLNSLCICFRKPLLDSKMYLPIQVLLSANFIMHHSIFLRVDVIKELARSFNFWFTIYNATSFHICFVALYGYTLDISCLFVHSFPSMILSIFFDAHAGNKTKIMKFASLIGIVSFSPIVCILLFRLVAFENEKLYHEASGVQIMDVRLQALDNLITVMIYLCRIFYAHHLMRGRSTTIAFLSDFYQLEYDSPTTERDSYMKSIIPGAAMDGKLHTFANAGKIDVKLDAESFQSNLDMMSAMERKKYLIIGINEGDAIRYDTHISVLKICFSEKTTLSKILKSNKFHITGLVISSVAVVISLPFYAGFMDRGGLLLMCCALISFGLLFISAQMILLSNIFMLKQMIGSFDFWYMIFLLFKILVSYGILCHWDFHSILWLLTSLCILWFIMLDAFPTKFRKLSWFAVLGILWALSAVILSKLNTESIFSRDRSLQIGNVINMSARITFSSSCFSVALFLMRFFWSYNRNPNRLLFLTKNVQILEP